MTDEIRTRDDLMRKYVEPMVALGYPRNAAVKLFDISYNIVDQMKDRIPEEAHKFAESQEEFTLIVSMAARMGSAMCDGIYHAMMEIERKSSQAEMQARGMGGMMDRAISMLLKIRGIDLDPQLHGVIVHMKADPTGCDCDNCKWYADAAKVPGMQSFTVSENMELLVGPIETVRALDDARTARRNGEATH